MALSKSMSCDHLAMSSNSTKQVRWSMDLEEIFYFTPPKPKPRRKSITERLREFKDKASDLADRTFRQNVHFMNRNSRQNSMFRRGYSMEFDNDLNRQWDEMFAAFYSEKRELST